MKYQLIKSYDDDWEDYTDNYQEINVPIVEDTIPRWTGLYGPGGEKVCLTPLPIGFGHHEEWYE